MDRKTGPGMEDLNSSRDRVAEEQTEQNNTYKYLDTSKSIVDWR